MNIIEITKIGAIKQIDEEIRGRLWRIEKLAQSAAKCGDNERFVDLIKNINDIDIISDEILTLYYALRSL